MGQAALNLPMTAAEFLAWEEQQTERHEYLAGEVFAMAGASDAHGAVAGNIYVALRQHLLGTPCRTSISDMRLRVEAADAYFYPDVMVTCSARDAQEPLMKREPVLVVEVLSPSTGIYDLGKKFTLYRTLPTLREVLFVDPEARRSDLYRRGDDGRWVLHPAEQHEHITFASVDMTLSSEALWLEVPVRSSDAES